MGKILTFLKRLGLKLLLILIVAATLTTLAAYFLNFSRGERSGKIVKLSQRGILVKTWECQMNMQAIGMDGTPTLWEFSIPRARRDLIDQVRSAMKEDAVVQIYYEEKLTGVFWEGDTKYWLTKVEVHPDQVK